MRNFTLALLIMIVPAAFLTGCGTIHFTGLSVIEEPDGVVVTNCTSDCSIVVKKLGGTSTGITARVVSSPMLPPGESWVVDTKNLSYNRSDTVLIWAEVYRNGKLIGGAQFQSVSVAPQTAHRDIWMVHDCDVHSDHWHYGHWNCR
ncbi:MAG: hypothetical protein Q7R85_03915 [bacterium]|nr:hypothetical protein [bacterium]